MFILIKSPHYLWDVLFFALSNLILARLLSHVRKAAFMKKVQFARQKRQQRSPTFSSWHKKVFAKKGEAGERKKSRSSFRIGLLSCELAI